MLNQINNASYNVNTCLRCKADIDSKQNYCTSCGQQTYTVSKRELLYRSKIMGILAIILSALQTIIAIMSIEGLFQIISYYGFEFSSSFLEILSTLLLITVLFFNLKIGLKYIDFSNLETSSLSINHIDKIQTVGFTVGPLIWNGILLIINIISLNWIFIIIISVYAVAISILGYTYLRSSAIRTKYILISENK